MGVIYDLIMGSVSERAGDSAKRALPPTPGDAVVAFGRLIGWLAAAGLILTGLMWLISGASFAAAIPILIGVALVAVLIGAKPRSS